MDNEQQKLMFDEKLNNSFREVAHKAFLDVPELRSVIVIYDYHRNLNDLDNISKGLWLSADGSAVKTIDSVSGSLGAVLQSAAHIFDDLYNHHQALQAELTDLSKQILRKREELSQ
jgi:hypothetical protein